jgi:hypothetical protein
MMRKIFVLAAAAVFVLGLSTSSWAVAEFDFGASIRSNFQWNQENKDRSVALGKDDSGVGETSFSMVNGGRSRIYMDGTLDDFTARLEIRLWEGNQIRADRASATWNFSEGMYFLFGYDSDLVDLHWSDAVLDNNANYGFGAIGDNKQVQAQIGGSTETFTWGVDLSQSWEGGLGQFAGLGNVTSEVTIIPRAEGIVKFAVGEMFDIGASGWFQVTEARRPPPPVGTTAGLSDKSITEWGINSRFRYFSDFVNVGLGAFYGKNLGISGVAGHPGWTATGATALIGGSVKDVTGYGIFLTGSFPIEPVTLGIGGGFESTSTDLSKGTAVPVVGGIVTEKDWTQWNFYVNVLYSFTDNFSIIPEFLYRDYGKSYLGVKQGNEWVIGARLQADF